MKSATSEKSELALSPVPAPPNLAETYRPESPEPRLRSDQAFPKLSVWPDAIPADATRCTVTPKINKVSDMKVSQKDLFTIFMTIAFDRY
jgi:hypothetical protein